MMNTRIYCKMVNEHKVNGKWIKTNDELDDWEREISPLEYYRITSPETIAFFRSLNGTERVTRDYQGRVERLVSTSPDKMKRVIYTFKFV